MRCSIPIFFVFLWVSMPSLAGPLGDAAKKGDIAEIDRLLASGSDANEPDAIASPLHWAAMHGHAEAVSLLAANGADLEAHSDMLGTPLHAAARFGREAAIEELLAAGLDPDVRDHNAFTPLMHAVMENRSAAVAALLAGGADVHAVGNAPGGRQIGAGPTIALQLAVGFGRDEIADMLRAAGAGPVPPEVPADLATRGDPARGRELALTYCQECHVIEAGDQVRMGDHSGPPLIGLVGRPVADIPEYEYSDALVAHGGTWTPERLYAFALAPVLTVPGTEMNWAPDRTPEMIADITAYFVSTAQ